MTAYYTSQEDERFFGAIGRLTISWAQLELGLDCMVEILYHGCDGKKIEPEMPRALRRKLSFLRAVFKRLPLAPEVTNNYVMLFDQIQSASQKRHDIIHGVIIEHAERSGVATYMRHIRDRYGVSKRQFKATTQTILEAAVEAQKLSSKMLKWADEACDLIDALSQQRDAQKLS